MTRRPADLRLESLLRTACEVVVERGFAETRVADVAAAAEVSQALVFYHFRSKERLLAEAYRHAVEHDLGRLNTVVTAKGVPARLKLRRLLTLYSPTGRSTAWRLWLDAWSYAQRNPELEQISRRLDLRWREALGAVIADGVAAAEFDCADPVGAAWRICALQDGLIIQATVHERVISRRQLTEWVRVGAARELGVKPEFLS